MSTRKIVLAFVLVLAMLFVSCDPDSSKPVAGTEYEDKKSKLVFVVDDNGELSVAGPLEAKESWECVIPNTYRGMKVTSIGQSAFTGCYGLVGITIPDTVNVIGNSAFEECSAFVDVTIPNSVTIIDNSAFEDCSELKSIVIPDSVTIIGSHSFCYCSSLEDVTIGKSVSLIDEFAFNGTAVSSITIPESVETIGEGAFQDCKSLTEIIIEKTKDSIDGAPWGAGKSVVIKWNED